MRAVDWRFLKWWCVMWGVGLITYAWMHQRYWGVAGFALISLVFVGMAWRLERQAQRGRS